MNRRRLLLVSFCLAALFPAARCVAAIRSGDNPKSNHQIVVLTYNIHHGEGTDGKFDLERIAGIIKRASPDIVSLQEVDRATVRSKGVDQAEELARLTGMNLAFGRAIDYQGGQYGNAVLTRFVIQRTATYPLPAPEPRALLAVECSLSSRGSPEDVFTFMATHLDWRNSIESVPLIEERFKEDPNKPALLAGDLNAGRDSPTMKLLGETWSIAAAASIDYILYRPANRWRAIEAKVLDEKVASDHPPVVAIVELLPAPKKGGQTGVDVISSARGEDLPDRSYKHCKIAFASGRPGAVDIYVMDADGKQQKRLTHLTDPHYVTHSCSPDGRKIAFETTTRTRRAVRDIVIMDADGTNQKRLREGSLDVADLAHSWAPDGKRLAFVRGRDDYGLYVANADGTETKRLVGSGVISVPPSWSPDGKRIAFDCYRDGDLGIHVMNADGSEHRELLSTRGRGLCNPSWSPDGRKVAYLLDRGIYVMNSDGSEQEFLGAYCYPLDRTLSWSPDGREIAFTMVQNRNRDIHVVDVDSGGITNLTNSAGDDECPVWSPDGKKIAFASGRDGNLEIYVMNADGSEQKRLTNDPADDYDPSWLAFLPANVTALTGRSVSLAAGQFAQGTPKLADAEPAENAEMTGRETGQDADGTGPILEELFARAKDNTGQLYAETRDELLAQGAPAIEFLEKKVRSRAPEQERWLAEIMLARAKEPAEFRDLELSFHKKVLLARYAHPVRLRRVRIPVRGTRLSLHSEVPSADKEHWEMLVEAALGGSLEAKAQKEFYELLRLSDSPLWKPLASEILLKGWTVPADSLWWPPPTDYSRSSGEYESPTDPFPRIYAYTAEEEGQPRSSDEMHAMLDQGDYLYHAIVLVGKFGERRAGDRVLEILQAIQQPIPEEGPATAGFFDCREAIRTLGKLRHREALNTLLKLAEDGRVPRGLRPDVLLSIAQIGDEKAIPVLERISKSQPDVAEDAKGLLEVLRGTRPVSDFEPLDD